MADDWWTGLVAPAGGGKSGLSGAENKELSDARRATAEGRDAFPAFGAMYRVANRNEGGIPANIGNTIKSYLPWVNEQPQVQDRALFDTLANRAAIAQAKMLTPVSNTDIALLKSSGPNPTLRFDNNKEIIGQQFASASRNYFENAFKQRWAARNNGLNGRDKRGRSYAEALASAMRMPKVQQAMLPPWKRGAQAPAGPTKITDDAGYERLPSGATFIGPDGVTRRKP